MTNSESPCPKPSALLLCLADRPFSRPNEITLVIHKKCTAHIIEYSLLVIYCFGTVGVSILCNHADIRITYYLKIPQFHTTRTAYPVTLLTMEESLWPFRLKIK